jgi:hypothetical protein
VPAVALDARRDKTHVQLVGKKASQHHGDLGSKVLRELLRHLLQQDAHIQALAEALMLLARELALVRKLVLVALPLLLDQLLRGGEILLRRLGVLLIFRVGVIAAALSFLPLFALLALATAAVLLIVIILILEKRRNSIVLVLWQ